jgi:hypothetical protein
VDVVCTGVMDSDNNENMLELGSNGLRGEGQSSRLLKDNGYYVISDVTLA